MKLLLFFTHNFVLKTAVLSDQVVRKYDCIVPQKTELKIPLNHDIENSDIVIIKDQETAKIEYIGIVDTVSHDYITTVLTFPIESIFDNDCILYQIDDFVEDWISYMIQDNYVDTGDPLNDFPIEFDWEYSYPYIYKRIVDDPNLLNNLNDIFLNTGTYIKFDVTYDENGAINGLLIEPHNANEEGTIILREDNPIILENSVLVECSHTKNPNKAIIEIYKKEDEEDVYYDTVSIYLRDDNKLTSSPVDDRRIRQVKPTLLTYNIENDDLTISEIGEAVVILAEKALCGNSFDHSIEFTVANSDAYDWQLHKRCDFYTQDRIYYTYVTGIERVSDKHTKVRLGAYRYSLTDRFKKLDKEKKEITSLNGVSVSEYFEPSIFWFEIDEEDHLVLHYPDTIAMPSFSINEDGDLIFEYEGTHDYQDTYFIDDEGNLVYNVI